MPIDFDNLPLIGLDQVDPLERADLTLREVFARLPLDRVERFWRYVVAPLPDGRFIVARWAEIEAIVARVAASRPDVAELALDELEGLRGTPEGPNEGPLDDVSLAALLDRLTPARALDPQTTSTAAARRVRDEHPGRRAVVVEAGRVVGLLILEVLAAKDLGDDPLAELLRPPALDRLPPELLRLRLEELLPGQRAFALRADQVGDPRFWLDQVTPRRLVVLEGPNAPLALLSDEPPPDPASLPADPFAAAYGVVLGPNVEGPRGLQVETIDSLVLNLQIDGHESGESLLVGRRYTLRAWLEEPALDNVFGQAEPDQAPGLWAGLELRLGADAALGLQGDGRSALDRPPVGEPNAAVFELTPQAAGVAALESTLLWRDAVVRQDRVSYVVEARADEASERLTLTIALAGYGYRFELTGAPLRQTRLANQPPQVVAERGLTVDQLDTLLRRAHATYREQVLDYAERLMRGRPPGEAGQLPRDDGTKLQLGMRELGRTLFGELFQSRQSDPGLRSIGELLLIFTQQRLPEIEVRAEGLGYPWALLHDGADDDALNPRGFWGARQPLAQAPPRWAPAQRASLTQPHLAVLHDPLADRQAQADIGGWYDEVLRDIAYRFGSATDVADAQALLERDPAPDVVFALCRIGGRRERPELLLGIEGLSVARWVASWRSQPAAVVLCCYAGLAEDPRFAVELAATLLEQGAGAVVINDFDLPPAFAAAFGADLVRRFVAGGQPLGDLLLDLRARYLAEYSNPLGMVFGLHGSGDVTIVPPTEAA